MRFRLLLTIILSLVSIYSTAQDWIRIRGIVIDAETKEKLPYAHIEMQGSNVGTVTNSLGEFSLKLPSSSGMDSVLVSYLGYEANIFPISSFLEEEKMQLHLKPDAIKLQEVVIQKDQKSLIEEAIEAIPMNYDLEEMMLDGFWRAQMMNDDETIQLSESAFEIYRMGTQYNKQDLKMKILRGRISRDSAAFEKLKNLQAGVSPSNLFKVSFLIGHRLFSEKVLKKHEFDLVDVTTYNGLSVYVLEFDRKSDYRKTGYKGRMLIETESLAFVRITYGLSYNKGKNPRLLDDSRFIGWVVGLSESIWNENYTELNYYKKNGKWYLSHSRYDASWSLIKSKDNYFEKVDYKADFLITDMIKDNYVLPSSDEFAKNRILENQFGGEDPDFWKDFNYLVPDENFDKIFEDIRLRNSSK